MLFNSLQFLVFFPVVFFVYFSLPHRFRWMWLLAASCYFYMAFIPVYILILFFTIIIDYVAGILIENSHGKKRKLYLLMSIIGNVSVLFIFKYFNFFNGMFADAAAFLHWNYPIGALKILLPVGLSFHTFQAMSYTIEVYRGNQKAERQFGIYALYVMFFPQLVAGPIERPQNLLHQFYEKHDFNYKNAIDGFKLMGWGFFKKVVLADRLASLVNMVYDKPTAYSGAILLAATYFFAFQIYCDFSGYSDIARGSAQVFGFRLMNNFNRPYFSKSIPEFWRRWHISLSTWFKDYVYFPLGGSRVSRWRHAFNLFIVFAISGLWHGANWTYVAWGSLLGLFMIASTVTAPIRARIISFFALERWPILLKISRVFITFHLTIISWVFFRSQSIGDALYVLKNIFIGRAGSIFASGEWAKTSVVIASMFIVLLVSVEAIQRRHQVSDFIARQSTPVRWATYIAVLWLIIIFGKFGSQQFIYFVF